MVFELYLGQVDLLLSIRNSGMLLAKLFIFLKTQLHELLKFRYVGADEILVCFVGVELDLLELLVLDSVLHLHLVLFHPQTKCHCAVDILSTHKLTAVLLVLFLFYFVYLILFEFQ